MLDAETHMDNVRTLVHRPLQSGISVVNEARASPPVALTQRSQNANRYDMAQWRDTLGHVFAFRRNDSRDMGAVPHLIGGIRIGPHDVTQKLVSVAENIHEIIARQKRVAEFRV